VFIKEKNNVNMQLILKFEFKRLVGC